MRTKPYVNFSKTFIETIDLIDVRVAKVNAETVYKAIEVSQAYLGNPVYLEELEMSAFVVSTITTDDIHVIQNNKVILYIVIE